MGKREKKREFVELSWWIGSIKILCLEQTGLHYMFEARFIFKLSLFIQRII